MKILSTQKDNKPKVAYGVETVRMRFAKARKFINPVNYIVQMGYSSKWLKRKTPLGKAMQTILSEAIVGTYPNITVDPSRAKLSIGLLSNPADLVIERDKSIIRLSWMNMDLRLNQMDHSDDRILLCAYAVDQELAAINEEEVWRDAGKLEMILPEGMETLPVHLYLIVHDRKKVHFSNSMYLGLL